MELAFTKMVKIAIVGSRDFNDFETMDEIVRKNHIERLEIPASEVIIVSRGANGADKLAEKLAKLNKYRMIIFCAEWEKYGRKAGMMRNQHIVENSDIVFAFWDGKSPGTANSIQRARKIGKPLHVYRYTKD